MGKIDKVEDVIEGEYSLQDEVCKSRYLGESTLPPRFSGMPDKTQLANYVAKLTSPDKGEVLGKGFKQLFALLDMQLIMRRRHYLRDGKNGVYVHCLSLSGDKYCPACLSRTIDEKERSPQEAYLARVLYFDTDHRGEPILDESGNMTYRPAFAIFTGRKLDSIKGIAQNYSWSVAGVLIQTTVEDPSFSKIQYAALPDRNAATKWVRANMLAPDDPRRPSDMEEWDESVYETFDERLPEKKEWVKQLCQSFTVAEMIEKFNLSDMGPDGPKAGKKGKAVVTAAAFSDPLEDVPEPAAKPAAAKPAAAKPAARTKTLLDDAMKSLAVPPPSEVVEVSVPDPPEAVAPAHNPGHGDLDGFL